MFTFLATHLWVGRVWGLLLCGVFLLMFWERNVIPSMCEITKQSRVIFVVFFYFTMNHMFSVGEKSGLQHPHSSTMKPCLADEGCNEFPEKDAVWMGAYVAPRYIRDPSFRKEGRSWVRWSLFALQQAIHGFQKGFQILICMISDHIGSGHF